MARVMNLPVIRKALAELDRIAAEHPEICQGVGQWDEKAVAGILTGKPGSERQAEYRRKLAAQGIKREVFFATPEAQTALAELRTLYPEKTRDTILCDAVLSLLAAHSAPVLDTGYDAGPLMREVDRRVNAGEKWRDIARLLNDAGWRDKKDRPLVFSRLNEQWRVWKQERKV